MIIMETNPKYTALLQTYLRQLKGDYEAVEASILHLQPNIEQDELYTIATWLWVLQKQVGLTPNNQRLNTINYEPYVSYLTKEWRKEHRSIWEQSNKDIYLANLAMTYAALQETKHIRGEAVLQKTMTAVRDFIFDHLLSRGTALNSANSRTISVEQTLAVMPYGLFSPEDLIMVEATQQMVLHFEEDNGLLPFRGATHVSLAATAMIALYYLEKSEREKAFRFANYVKQHNKEDKLAEVIIGMFDFYASGENIEDKILHDPLGNENVYESQATERFPHYPTLEDPIHFACEVTSNTEILDVGLVMENKSKTWDKEISLKAKNVQDTVIYQGTISSLPNHEKYTYYFYANLENGKQLQSQYYKLMTWKKDSLQQFEIIAANKNEVKLALSSNQTLHISLRDEGMSLNFHQHGEQQLGENQQDSTTTLVSGEFRLEVEANNPSLSLYKGEKKLLTSHSLYPPIEWKMDVNGVVREWNIHWESPLEEQFYGFGERYNAIEQRGNVIDCYVYNQYRDQGTRTYIPIPFYMTNSGYGCYINTASYTKFDLASELKDKCTMMFEQHSKDKNTEIQFYFGTYKEQLAAYTNVTGNSAMVPAWALGPWMSSNNWDRQSIIKQEVEATKKHNIPATVIVLEQWSDEATYYMFNDAMYDMKEPGHIHHYEEMEFPSWGRWPDPKQMVEELHEDNLKLILWQIPIQKYLNKQNHPLKDQDETYMIENGYVVQNEDGSPYRIPENWFTNSLIMDFSHDEGRKWWFAKRQYLIELGVDGFKTDGGEFVFGKNLQFANGKTGSEMRNVYPNDYIESYYHFAQQNNGITFSRAGYTGAQNFPAHWAGDERSTFDAFKRSLVAGLNAGLAGIVFWGWDLAGFNGDIPTAELFMRSSSMAAFCPIMQYHAESKAEFSQDRTPWNIATRTGEDNVIDVYRFFANVRMNLIPYIYHESKKATKTGFPLMKALMLEYPEDTRVEGLYDEYMFGDAMLVAPIIEEEAISRKVYLPNGTWVDLWSNAVHQGPTVVTSKADVDEIPVFVRMNSAVLLNVDETRQLGSSVGNDVSQYQIPLCKVYCETSFAEKMVDHLGHTIEINVEVHDHEIVLETYTELENLQFEVIGKNKPFRIVGRD
ncbi:glycoside hydrolase family 31 protein [Pontibacillus yanchengensis]|uniref:Glycoside hydrolase family 31 protein n=3 Tax=Pontibacillus yanchengensis TaxID=462910 RepID=A0A6I4ZWN7_9BACI|nr:glycoside hydrolase family 31 protein [Pontibacillus yanchengensis]MYL52753.1 glycoside hydrolase family 31 protein [Pontibacillus yanchengensis]